MKRRKLIFSNLIVFGMVFASAVTPVFANAYNYKFETDTDKTFGNHTFTSDQSYFNNNENIRKDKNYSYLPPNYGLFSGEFETPNSNPFMTKLDITTATNETFSVPNDGNTSGVLLPSTSLMNTYDSSNYTDNSTVSFSNNDIGFETEVKYYDDGSIGKLALNGYNVNVKVYEGETLENLRLGVGHFKNTSAWDGNVAMAGHNRGAYGYFNALKSMKKGDTVTYTTKYGTRTYEMVSRNKINFNDMSYFDYSAENILTLVTCVEDEPSFRYVVTFKEK